MCESIRRGCVVLLIWVCLLPPAAIAQQTSEGEAAGSSVIVGKIEAADGKPAQGVRVLVYHLSTEKLYTSEPTGKNGEYRFEDLPYGYFDVAVETPEGVFVADQVCNLPPSTKIAAQLVLTPFDDTEARPPREFTGSDLASIGWARVKEKPRGADFWKSTKGIAILAGLGGVALLALASSGGESSASSF